MIKIDLDAENSNEISEESPGTPLLLNDDWDCQQRYGAGAGGGHRELEPIWDKDYTAGQVAAEDDLMRVRLAVSPAALTGNVTLKITSGADKIRLWPRATKGLAGEIITIPPQGRTYAISALPTDIYVEGLDLGRAVMTLEYTVGTTTFIDKLNIDVVTLIESQGGQRRVINAYNSDISFVVTTSGGALSSQYIFHWDLDGNGVRNNGAWESDTDSDTVVKYSADPNGAGNVQLPANAANRRKTYDVSVLVTSPTFSCRLEIDKTIRVALGTYEGTAVATTEAGRRTEVAGLATPPAGFTDTPASGTYSQTYFESTYGVEVSPPGTSINAGNRLQYATLLSGVLGSTPFDGGGDDRRVFAVMISPDAYGEGFKREDLASVAEHECQHARQMIAVATGGNNWRAVDDYYGGILATNT